MKNILIIAAFALSLAGQNFQHTRIYTVKQDHIAEWENSIKELKGIYQKANLPIRTLVYQSLTGPENFLVVRFYDKISQALANRSDAFKGNFEADYRVANIRLRGTVAERRTRVGEVLLDSTIRETIEPAPSLRTTRIQVTPGNREAMRATPKELAHDGMKPSGVKIYVVSETRMGGPVGEFSTAMGVNSLSDLDNFSTRKAMGDAKYNAWAQKRDALTVSAEVNAYRFRPELSSYTPAK